jgi:hypothetical protein
VRTQTAAKCSRHRSYEPAGRLSQQTPVHRSGPIHESLSRLGYLFLDASSPPP